jgi:DNA-directed RNA polymerase specialized sigma24 family protein
MIAYCHVLLGEIEYFEQVLVKVNLEQISAPERIFFKLTAILIAYFYTLKTSASLVKAKDYTNALNKLESSKSLYPRSDLVRNMLLCDIYQRLGNIEKIICVAKETKKIAPQFPLVYDFLGKAYISRNNFRMSSLYLRKAASLYQSLSPDNNYRVIECEILCEFSSGMLALQKFGMVNKNGLKETLNHFHRCANLVKKNKMDSHHSYRRLQILPHLIELDERIYSLRDSFNLIDLNIRVQAVLLDLFNWGIKFGLIEKQQSLTKRVKADIISSIFATKLCYISYLHDTLANKDFDEVLKLNGNIEIQRHALYEKWMNVCKLFFENLKLEEDSLIFENLVEFKEKIAGRSIDNIPENEQMSLLKTLLPNLNAVSNDFSLRAFKEIALLQEEVQTGRIEQKEMARAQERGQKTLEEMVTAILSIVKKAPSDIINIDFFTEKVRINGLKRTPFKKSRERYLLEQLVLQKKLHYLHSFIVFKERGYDFICSKFVKNPFHLFVKHISALRDKIKNIKDRASGESIIEIGGPHGGYYDIIEKKKFDSNIKKAMEKYEKAKKLFKEKKYGEAIRELSLMCVDSAITKYNSYLNAYILLAECYVKIVPQRDDNVELRNVERFLEKWDAWYCEAIGAIKEYLKRLDNRKLIGNEESVFEQILKKQGQIRNALEALKQYPIPKTEEDIKWDKFDEIQSIIEQHSTEEETEDTIDELYLHSELKEVMHEIFSRVIKRQFSYLGAMRPERKAQAKKEIYIKATDSFIDILRQRRYKRTDFVNFAGAINVIVRKINESFEPAKGPDEKRNDTMKTLLVKYESAIRKQGLEHLSYEQQRKILGWSQDTLWSVITYLNEKKACELNDEYDQSKETQE